jgi:predicted metal-dependent phosphoesterase TrpH
MSPGPRLDLHVHSRHSPDGGMTVAEIADAAARAGLDGFALTDHNSVRGHAELPEVLREHADWIVVPGVEVSTLEGHLLIYGVAEAPVPRRPAAETIAWAVERHGVPVLAHPFRWSHGVGRALATTLAVPAIEALNGHNRRTPNERARKVMAERSLGAAGGSDAHRPAEVGRAFTRFPEGTRTTDAALTALQTGSTTADGASATALSAARAALRSAALRLGRGFRPI